MSQNSEFSQQIKTRTFDVSVRIIKVTQALPNNTVGWKIGDQIIRSGTAIGALCEEALACALLPEKRLHNLIEEIDEIAGILTATVKTGEQKLNSGR